MEGGSGSELRCRAGGGGAGVEEVSFARDGGEVHVCVYGAWMEVFAVQVDGFLVSWGDGDVVAFDDCGLDGFDYPVGDLDCLIWDRGACYGADDIGVCECLGVLREGFPGFDKAYG